MGIAEYAWLDGLSGLEVSSKNPIQIGVISPIIRHGMKIKTKVYCIALAAISPLFTGCTLMEAAVTGATLGLVEPDLDGENNNISPWALNHSGPSGSASAPITGKEQPNTAEQKLPALAPVNKPSLSRDLQVAPETPRTAKTPTPVLPVTTNQSILGVWKSDEGIWRLNKSGAGTLTMDSVNGNPGTLTTYFNWTHNPGTGQFTYTINRMVLSGSAYDYDRSMNKTYTVPYTLSDRRLQIDKQVFYR